MTGRGIDHIGILGRSLDSLASQYEDLGFRLTPRAFHQDSMGTSNRLAQFAGRNFIELIELDRPETVQPHAPGFYSFGGFAQDFLAMRDGLGLVVFQTHDTPADIARWKQKGLTTYDQFDFERKATLPDGSLATVRFELGFVTSPMMPELLFFVCHNRAEEHFWKPEFQAHPNGAEEIEAVVLCSAEPERHGVFLSELFDGEVTEQDEGVRVACGRHWIDVRTPHALADTGWRRNPGAEAVGAGFQIRTEAPAGAITPSAEAGGAFIIWNDTRRRSAR